MAASSTGAERLCLALVLVIVLTACLANGECVIDTCCCYSDNYNDTLRAKIAAFTNLTGPSPDYEYIGAMPKASDTYDPCFCSDVTRVTTKLKLKKTAYITQAKDATQRTTLTTDVNSKLSALLPTMKNSETDLVNTLVSIKAVYDSHTDAEVTFNVEILLRGRDEGLITPVSKALAVGLAKDSLGPVDSGAMAYAVVKCTADPPAALLNGQRVVNTGNVASSFAIYTCDARYNMSSDNSEEQITCSHTNLQWSALPTGLQCNPGTPSCAADPPPAPTASISSWNNFSKSEATAISYVCLDGYSSQGNVNAISICQSGTWLSIISTFKCIQTGCLDPPPQIPTQGVLNWNQQRADGTVVSYSCNNGFKSNTGVDPKATCTNMTWVGFPNKWACVDENTKLKLGGSGDDDEEEEMNYFLIVTIPSVVGLIFMILCCLCCTRIDSPLFNICSARGNNDGYTSA